MIERLQLEWQGRPVRLRYIEELLTAKGVHGHTVKYFNRRVWNTIMSKKWDGHVYALSPTALNDAKAVQKIYIQLTKKKYMLGYDQQYLKIKATLQDGICFSWASLNETETKAAEMIAASLRARRLVKRYATEHKPEDLEHQPSQELPSGEGTDAGSLP